MTYDDFSNLTPGQRAKLDEFGAIGVQVQQGRPPATVSGLTDQQAKSAANFLKDVSTLINPTIAGVTHVRQLYQNQAIKQYDDSVVPGP